MSDHPRILTIAQWAAGANWALELQHSCADHALVWQTRGQGRCVIEGIRRGFGVHTALAIPAGTPFSLELNLLRLKSEGSVGLERLRRTFESFSD